MSDPAATADEATRRSVAEAVEHAPVGLAVFDAGQRVVAVNAAYCGSMSMPAGSFAAGMTLEDLLRVGAYRGLLGPGDPEEQVRAALAIDRSRPIAMRRRMFDGRSFDLHSAPLPGGGHVVSAVDVTPLMLARNEAEAGARRIANVVSTLRTGLAAFAPDRTLLLHNARFAELVGLPLAALRDGMAFDEMLGLMRAADEYASLDGEAFVALQHGLDRSRPFSARRVRSDGRVADVASDPLPDGGWTTTIADVSALARAEDDSRRRARMLDGILDNIPHGIAVYGPDLRVSMINPAYHAIMPKEALRVGDHLEDMIAERVGSGDIDAEGGRQFAVARRGATRAPAHWRRTRPSGRSLDVRTAPLPDGGHMSVITDVTAQVQAEADARRRAAELDAMLASTRHGIALFDAGGRLIAGNRAAAVLMRVPATMAMAEPLQAHLASVQDEGGDGRTWLRRHATPDGRTLEIQSNPGSDDGRVLTYTDITPFLDAEQALRRARDAAEAASRAKSRFLATMSHELRTPLNAVIGFSEALTGGVEGTSATAPAAVDEFARMINAAGHQLLQLVNNVLDVARLEPGQFGLSRESVPLDAVIGSAVKQVAPMADAAQIDVRCLTPDTGLIVLGDPERLARCVGQLLSNAVKFTPAGGRAWVSLGRAPSGDVVLEVADTGVGIPDADLERVFEPFMQVDTGHGRQFAGAGLGLYVARSLIEAHGGTLRVRPRPDGGTVAELTLPASLVDTGPKATAQPISAHKETA